MDFHDSEYRGLGPHVTKNFQGYRLDRYLAHSFPFRARPDWKNLCESRMVLVDGRPGRSDLKLKGGEVLQVYHPIADEPEVLGEVDILFKTDSMALIAKPAGLPMHESGYFRRRTVQASLHAALGSSWDAVHRLDRETSGILLCAGQTEIKAKLALLFEEKEIAKSYLAIVEGIPSWREYQCSAGIATDESSGFPRYQVAEHGVYAETFFRVIAQSHTHALIQAFPRTGRTHQIRVHLSHLGFPLLGDKVYNAQGNGSQRHGLHAYSLSFVDPLTLRAISHHAPIPLDFRLMMADVGLVTDL